MNKFNKTRTFFYILFFVLKEYAMILNSCLQVMSSDRDKK